MDWIDNPIQEPQSTNHLKGIGNHDPNQNLEGLFLSLNPFIPTFDRD